MRFFVSPTKVPQTGGDLGGLFRCVSVTLFRLVVQNGGGFQWDRVEVYGSESTDGAAVVAFAVVFDGGEKQDCGFVDYLFAGGFVGLLAGV